MKYSPPKAVIVACSVYWHTLPKWNILWKAVIVAYSVYWHTLPKWNILCIGTPSQSEIFSEKLLLFCILAHPPKVKSCSVYWHTLPKWNILLPKLLLYLVLYIGSCYCILFCILAHPPKVKYSPPKAVIVACSVYWHTLPKWNILWGTPSQSEIFSSCYCSLFCILAHPPKVKYSLYWHTLPKWNILWKAVIVLYIGTPSQSEILFCILAHPPKVKYSPPKAVIVSCSVYWQLLLYLVLYIGTPSQSEIFSSQSCYCSLFCILAHPPKVKYSLRHTLPKWNILLLLL